MKWLGIMLMAACGSLQAVELEVSKPAGGNSDMVEIIVRQVFDARLQEALFSVVLWVILGGVLGLLFCILAIWGLGKLGWFASRWKYAGVLRWLLWIFMVGACVSCAAVAGFWHGTITGVETVLNKSQIGTKLLPEMAGYLADGMAAVQVYNQETNETALAQSNLMARVDAFRAGQWELDATAIGTQLRQIRADSITNLAVELENQAASQIPQFRDSSVRKILHGILMGLGVALAQNQLESQLRNAGLEGVYQALTSGLVAEAHKKGDPRTISRQDMALYLSDQAVKPLILKPVRSFARSHELLFFILALVFVFIPALVFKLSCCRSQS